MSMILTNNLDIHRFLNKFIKLYYFYIPFLRFFIYWEYYLQQIILNFADYFIEVASKPQIVDYIIQ